jgi:1-deoxy-D-xylulose-5-phosphate synthase
MLHRYFNDILQNINKKFDEYVRGMATGGTFFEELGFYYVGPVDAHDLDNLVPIIENIRDNVPNTKPVLLHVKSVKGKGKQKYITYFKLLF